MTPIEEVCNLLDERGIHYDASNIGYVTICLGEVEYTFYERTCKITNKFDGMVFVTTNWLFPEQAIAATVGNTMTLDEATEYAEKFMSDYEKVLLASTLYVERDEPTDQHALNIAEQKEAQMARDLAEALATVGEEHETHICKRCGVAYELNIIDKGFGKPRFCPNCGFRKDAQ